MTFRIFLLLPYLIALVPQSGYGVEPARKPPSLEEVEPGDCLPGLLAHYRSLTDRKAKLERIDAKPAFYLGHSSPHPRIPPGPFEVVWTGVLQLTETTPLSFEALVCGEIAVEIDGVLVLEGKGEKETSLLASKEKLKRTAGLYRLKIRYRSLPQLPARLQLWWQGDSFSKEPLAAWYLKHLPSELPKSCEEEQLADRGRTVVERMGCAQCHSSAFQGVSAHLPGPSLADVRQRLDRTWLLNWLENPGKTRKDARMPVLFEADRKGYVERRLIVDYLLGSESKERTVKEGNGDHRMGRRLFVASGCATCHFLPDTEIKEQPRFRQTPLTGLSDRLPAEELTAFLGNPLSRYPDGRMPRVPVTPDTARDIAAYLLLWSKPVENDAREVKPPTDLEIGAIARRLGTRAGKETALALLREKRCAECHPGLGQGIAADVALKDTKKGCLGGTTLPRFEIDTESRKALTAYLTVAAREKHPSSFAARQRMLDHLGCVQCHQRDTDRVPPIEAVGSTLGSAWLQNVPFQKTPRLSYPHQKYTREHLLSAVREGVHGLRAARYSYRMPAFGRDAEAIVQALAEGDGELPDAVDPPQPRPDDPTLGPLMGSSIAGFQGYGCVSCHIWNGQALGSPDPGAVGTDLTRVSGRIRREWFDRFIEAPARWHPGTPMPMVFEKGKPAQLRSILDGDAAKQKEALWEYFAMGKNAPTPKPPPPTPIDAPRSNEPPLVAQIPFHLPEGGIVESLTLLSGRHDLVVFDLGKATLQSIRTQAQLLRTVQGRLRTFTVSGIPLGPDFRADAPLVLLGKEKEESPTEQILHGYDRLADGARLRWRVVFPSATVERFDTLRFVADGQKSKLFWEVRITGGPVMRPFELRLKHDGKIAIEVPTANSPREPHQLSVPLKPDKEGTSSVRLTIPLPSSEPTKVERILFSVPDRIEGTLERPGYKAIAYPRPKTVFGEDRIMPSTVAADPKDGRVFVASMKTGELFVVNDPTDDGKKATFENYTRGLYQEAYSMLAEKDALYVLHRRNLTRILDTDRDGKADKFERIAALPHGIGDTYDYGYGLTRDKCGAFVYSFAPHANHHLSGSGSALRLVPGKKPEEVGFGFRNPLGWCSGPDGEVFYTDNQGEWVATNKLVHLQEGRYHGYPNSAQREHAKKPFAKTTVWVPYAWAKSINGVTYDNSGGKFGPFEGQIFMAELMFGGAILRANVEKVNGVYQGACFPFWGRGLLGPVTLTFDPKGRLWVGGITEPGWMAQPDRGALFRLDYTGKVPFEMKSIHVRPHGFRIVFTDPVDPKSARDPSSFRIDHHRYEYGGAYGSPELDRTQLKIERIEVASDGRSVEVTTDNLIKDRVYMIQATDVRSAKGASLVHTMGAYTLNEIPRKP